MTCSCHIEHDILLLEYKNNSDAIKSNKYTFVLF